MRYIVPLICVIMILTILSQAKYEDEIEKCNIIWWVFTIDDLVKECLIIKDLDIIRIHNTHLKYY